MMLGIFGGLIISTIITNAICPPAIPYITKKFPDSVLNQEITEAQLKESVIKFGLAGDQHRMCVELDALAELYDKKKQFNEAEKHYVATIGVLSMLFGKNSSQVAFEYARLATHYVLSKEYALAQKANSIALKILSSAQRVDPLKLGMVYHNQAWLEAGHSSWRVSEQHYKKSIALFKKSERPMGLMLGLSYYNLAKLYLSESKDLEAEDCFHRSYEILSARIPNDAIFKDFLKDYSEFLRKRQARDK